MQNRVLSALHKAMPVMMDTTGATLITVGTWHIHQAAGWITAGASLLILSWKTYDKE